MIIELGHAQLDSDLFHVESAPARILLPRNFCLSVEVVFRGALCDMDAAASLSSDYLHSFFLETPPAPIPWLLSPLDVSPSQYSTGDQILTTALVADIEADLLPAATSGSDTDYCRGHPL